MHGTEWGGKNPCDCGWKSTLIVYFDGIDDMPYDKERMFLGEPLLIIKNNAIYTWAIDYVTSDDEQWTVFGPYKSDNEAKKAFKRISKRQKKIDGYRVVSVSWWQTHKRPRVAWTDG